MAYYLDAARRMKVEVNRALRTHFGDNADVILTDKGLEVYVQSGYPKVERVLSPEELEAGIIGGGTSEKLDGFNFIISIKKEN